MPSDTTAKPTALVTGSSGGIGRAISLRLAKDGYHVLLHFNKNQSSAEKTREQIIERGGSADIVGFNVKDSKDIEAQLKDRDIDLLVNNAGLHIDTLTGLMSDESFDEVMKTNVYGPFYLMRFCVRKMLRRRVGNVINISSLAGQTGNPGQINYAASKAALIAMTKTLAMEVGSRGIRVNAVAPGLIETEMISQVPQLEQMKQRIPRGRFGSADEVAGTVSFLASKDAGYITGHTISVNGGLFPS